MSGTVLTRIIADYRAISMNQLYNTGDSRRCQVRRRAERQQEKGLGFPFDRQRASTHAGFAKDGRARRVIGIDAPATPKQTKAQVIKMMAA